MPPIHMTREERAVLVRLAESPLPVHDLPRACAEKFLNHGLVQREFLRYRITVKGQLEMFRQRFRNLATRRKVKVSDDLLGRLDAVFTRRRRPRRVARKG